jgi:hypothetical protein
VGLGKTLFFEISDHSFRSSIVTMGAARAPSDKEAKAEAKAAAAKERAEAYQRKVALEKALLNDVAEEKQNFQPTVVGEKVAGFRKQKEFGEKKRIKP